MPTEGGLTSPLPRVPFLTCLLKVSPIHPASLCYAGDVPRMLQPEPVMFGCPLCPHKGQLTLRAGGAPAQP